MLPLVAQALFAYFILLSDMENLLFVCSRSWTLKLINALTLLVQLTYMLVNSSSVHHNEWTYSQAAQVSATPLLRNWTYYMTLTHSITVTCTCVNNTSYNQPKVVTESEIPAPRGKEWQDGVADTQAAWQYD